MDDYEHMDDDLMEAQRQLHDELYDSDSGLDDLSARPPVPVANAARNKTRRPKNASKRATKPVPSDINGSANAFEMGLELDDIRELEEDNARLMVLVEEKESDIQNLRQALKSSSGPAVGGGSGVAENRIIDLSKKNRNLSVSLERERTNRKRLEREVSDLNRALQQTVQAAQSASTAPAEETRTPKRDGSKGKQHDWEDKYQNATNRISEYRIQVQNLKAELALAQKTLQRELGDDVPLTKALDESKGWRGRAEQISLLKAKLRDQRAVLPQRAAAGLNESGGRAGSSGSGARSRSKELASVTEKLEKTEVELEAAKQLIGARLARIKTLERETQSLRSKMKVLLEKADDDDALIETLKRGASKSGDNAGASNKREIEKLRQLVSQQERQLENCGQETDNLRAEIKRLKLASKTGGASGSDSGSMSSAEKKQMDEIVAMLQQQLTEAEDKIDELEGQKGSINLINSKKEQERANQYLWEQLEDLKKKYSALLQEVQEGSNQEESDEGGDSMSDDLDVGHPI